jgi:hypothetical protein
MSCYPFCPQDTFYCFNVLLPFLSARYILLFQCPATLSVRKIHFIVSMSCYPFCPQYTFYCFNVMLPFLSARHILLFQCFATVSVRKIHFIISMSCNPLSPQDTLTLTFISVIIHCRMLEFIVLRFAVTCVARMYFFFGRFWMQTRLRIGYQFEGLHVLSQYLLSPTKIFHYIS